MTYLYEWYSPPKQFDVVCPNCGRPALCQDVKTSEKGCIINLARKPAPLAKSRLSGSISCLHCGFRKSTFIRLPADLYWCCDVKGKLLWAWSRKHAALVLDYLTAKDRNLSHYKHSVFLLHIPKHFKLAKNRPAAVKALTKLLTAQL